MTDEKKAPTSLRRGMPPEQTNGLFGAEDRIMGLGVKGRMTAVVTVEVFDIVHSDADGSARPIVEIVHIEPVWDSTAAATAQEVQAEAYKERTGANQLNFEQMPAAAVDRTSDDDEMFEAAAPKLKAVKK